MTFDALLEYGGWIAVLWVAAEATLAGFLKPMVLKPLRPQLDKLHANAYAFAVKVALFVSGGLVANTMIDELDVLGRWWPEAPIWVNNFGVAYSPWYGAVISLLVMTVAGQWIHDYFKSHDIVLPGLVKKA